MAAVTATDHSVEQVDKVQLMVMVDKGRNKVVYAEAGKDFIDILFSFFTLPLGTIARLVSKESNIEAVRVGSLNSLYQSVADLKEQFLSTPTCKEMLFNPRNSMEDYCRNLKLNIDDTEPLQYFRCSRWECNRSDSGCNLSTFRNQKCSCGKVMEKEVFPNWLNLVNGFVNETATFIISDDLVVMPNVFSTVLSLLQKLEVDNCDTLQEQTVDITTKEVIDLLKLSLLSKTPLTDFIFNKKQRLGNSNTGEESMFDIGKVVSADEGREMLVKLIIRKSNGEIVFADAEKDFVDFLFSFLTFPVGGVLHMLEGFISSNCLYNLYESMNELNPDKFLISPDFKGKLHSPKIASKFELTNQILPIGATPLPVYYCQTYCSRDFCVDLTKDNVVPDFHSRRYPPMCLQFSLVDPESSSSKSSSSVGFTKGPSTYMVTDDLVVTPMLSTSALSYLTKSKVPLSDLEEKVVTIGMKEGLAILKASLFSPTALTNSLNQFIGLVKDPVKRDRIVKQENSGWVL